MAILKHKSAFTRLSIFLLLLLTCTIVANALWWVLLSGNQSTESLKVLQLFNSVGMFIIPIAAYTYLSYDNPISFLYLNSRIRLKDIVLSGFIILAALPFINLMSNLNQELQLPAALSGLEEWMKASEQAAEQMTKQFLQAENIPTLLFNIFLMAIIPAIGEELFFRGTIQQLIYTKGGRHLAIWITAIIFSAIHLQFYGFVPRMMLGALFGYMLIWSGSLWIPIITHFTNNACAVLSYYIIEKNNWESEQFEQLGTGNTLWLGVASGIITIGGIYLLRRSLTISSASSRKSIGS